MFNFGQSPGLVLLEETQVPKVVVSNPGRVYRISIVRVRIDIKFKRNYPFFSSRNHEIASDLEEKIEKMMEITKDCTHRVCELTFAIVNTCILYLKTDENTCDVPCDTRDCKIEVHHEIRCPIWTCKRKPTTTTTTSSTTYLPEPTWPPSPAPSTGDCYTAACISASTFAAILTLAVIILIILFVKNRRILRNLRARLSQYTRVDDDNTPILRGSSLNQRSAPRSADGFENVPLNAIVIDPQQSTSF